MNRLKVILLAAFVGWFFLAAPPALGTGKRKCTPPANATRIAEP